MLTCGRELLSKLYWYDRYRYASVDLKLMQPMQTLMVPNTKMAPSPSTFFCSMVLTIKNWFADLENRGGYSRSAFSYSWTLVSTETA